MSAPSGNSRIVPFTVTIEQFLKAVFGARWGEALVAYFPGDPKPSNPLCNWTVYPAATVMAALTPALNLYYDVSLPAGSTRQAVDFGALYVILLDDYGTKVDKDKIEFLLGTPPSYVIETSPGNFQAGWFIEPLTDQAWVNGLLRLLYEAMGQTGDNLVKPTTLVRLPAGTNGKKALGPGGFKVRLVHWRPNCRITRLDWINVEKRIGVVIPITLATGSGDKRMPDPGEIEKDPILRVFREQGMVLDSGSRRAFGWAYEVQCPQAAKHTDGRVEAHYVPVWQKFKCHHHSCENFGREAVRRWADGWLMLNGEMCVAGHDFDDVDPTQWAGQTSVGHAGNPALGSYEATEDGLTQAFTAQHEGQLQFDHNRQKWFVRTQGFWREDEIAHAFAWARQLAREFRTMQDTTAGQIRTMGKIAFAAAIERAARTDPRLATDGLSWDPDPWLAGAPGCEIDLRTGAVGPPDPAHMITRQLLVAPADIPTPLWDQFIWDSTGGDMELVTFLQAWCGYCLTGDTSEEKFVFIYGPGGNGKGTFLFTINAILNDYAARTPAETFMVRTHDAHPTEIARLMGVRAVTATEIEEGRTFNAGRLKDFTGRDGKLMGRFMRRDWFEFTPQFKVTFVGNNQPRITNVDDAMRRRVVLVPFVEKPKQVNTTLKDQLVAEYSGILRWMIEGENLRRAMGGLTALIPAAATLATSAYLDDQDTLKVWASERCVFGPRDQMGVTAAFEDYKSWCFGRGDTCAVSLREFSRKFLEAHPRCEKTHNRQGWFLVGASLLTTNC